MKTKVEVSPFFFKEREGRDGTHALEAEARASGDAGVSERSAGRGRGRPAGRWTFDESGFRRGERMKALCNREGLLAAFGMVSGVVPARSPKPILQNVKLVADADEGSVLMAHRPGGRASATGCWA